MLDLAVSGSTAGLQLTFQRQDFQAHTVTLITQQALTVPVGAASLLLGFVHATPGGAPVRASWGFIDANNGFVGGLPVFSADTDIFHSADAVQLSLRAVQAVPEPAGLGMMLAGLAGLVARAKLRRRKLP